jgi:ABC-type phosphate transport system substrate-binding protein
MPFASILRRCFAASLAPLLLGAAGLADAADPSGIAVIIAPGYTVRDLDRHELALIYKRKKRLWPDGRRIAPVNLPAGQNIRKAFSVAVLGHTPEEMDDYWRDQYFHGELPPFVASSEEAVIRLVATTPGAIGYVPACLADKRVSVVLTIDDGLPCPR